MSKNVKRYLMLLMALGLIAIAANGSGTFASFDAEVTNPGNTFETGYLYLHQTQDGSQACNSETDTTNNQNAGCTFVFNDTNVALGAQTQQVEIKNAGSITASDITFSVPSCSVGTGGGSTTFGTAPGCGDVFVTIQEVSGLTSPTNVYCALGTDSSGTCGAPSSAHTLSNLSTAATLKTTGGVTAPLAVNATRYYVVTVSPDSSLTPNNVWQNRDVSFDLTWHLDQ
ncbi:MAG TPA: hypothetical protein VMH47_00975 [Gaiellaceae bacterium]|nr:hypothetical protein [Gaiellaceae bacterium]